MEITKINYPAGVAEAKGVKREIGLQLLPEDSIAIGDHVIVHVGFAIEKIEEKLATEIRGALDEAPRFVNDEEGA